jgi:hypothetical protein
LVIPVQSGFLLTDGTGESLRFYPNETKEIIVGWRHSVELTPWEEVYHVVENKKLSLKSTTYKAYGAGTPDIEGKVELLENGYIYVTEIKRVMPFYSLFYIPESNYYIKINEKKYLLSDFAPDYKNVQIHYKSIQGYEWIYLKLIKGVMEL